METASGSGTMSQGQVDEEKCIINFYEIMTAEENTEFTDNRKSFNENILSGNVTKEELLVQIKHESFELKTCEQKIEQIMKEPYVKNFKSKIKTILSNRIHDMYILLFKTFNFDVNLVSKYIQFCLENFADTQFVDRFIEHKNNYLWFLKNTQIDDNVMIQEKLTKNFKIVLDAIMNSSHSDPEIYITGAHHAYNDFNDIESARRYISVGMKFHEDFKKLHVEDFWIEMKHLNQTGGSSLQTALKKYNGIIQHFQDDINLHFDLVDIVLDGHIKMTQLQSIVIRDMVNQYRKNELMWQKLAKIHLNGFVYNYGTEILRKLEDIKHDIPIRNCINTYDKALIDGLSPENQQNLWNLFLDNIIDIYSSIDQGDKVNKDYINETIDRMFAKAYSIDTMKQPRHFIFWAERPKNKATKVVLLRKGLKISPDNLELWNKLLEYYLDRDFFRNGMAILTESFKILKGNSLSLWKSMELYVLCCDKKTTEQFFKEASLVVVNDAINSKYRIAYLEWSILSYDITIGRKVFSTLKNLEPKSHKMYKKMIEYETFNIFSKTTEHLKYMRNLYNEACNLFGHMDVELWCGCIQFEYVHGNRSLVDMIYEAGLNLLENPSLKEQLTMKKQELDERHKLHEVIDITNEDDE